MWWMKQSKCTLKFPQSQWLLAKENISSQLKMSPKDDIWESKQEAFWINYILCGTKKGFRSDNENGHETFKD